MRPVRHHDGHDRVTDPQIGLPISGMGGIRKWEDCVEFLLLGATTFQVCTAVMHRGFGIVKAMTRGLEQWLADKDPPGGSKPRPAWHAPHFTGRGQSPARLPRVSPGPDFVLVAWVPDMNAWSALVQRLFTQDANVRNVKTYFSVKRAKFEPRISLAPRSS